MLSLSRYPMMHSIISIITLPVYRLSREKYYKQRDCYIDKQIFGGPDGDFKRKFAKENPGWLETYTNHLHKIWGGCWEYNEIIGFIDLHFLGSQVRGEYFEDNKKRHVKSRKKQFEYITHKIAPELNFDKNATNKEIEVIISNYIECCRNELKPRYIDDSAFTNIKGYVDWKALMNKNFNK